MPLQLDPSGKFGTLEEQVLALALAFREAGSRLVPLFTRPLGPAAAAAYEALGIDAASLDLTRWSLATCRALLDWIGRERIDVVNWHFYPPVKNPYLWAVRLAAPSIAQVYTDHISRPSASSQPGGVLRRFAKRQALRPYSAALAVSDFVRQQLDAQGTWRRTLSIDHFVNVDRFRPDPAARVRVRGLLGVDDAAFVVLVVAHLIAEKGVGVALRALADLPPDVHLWVVGDGPERSALVAETETLGLGGRVRFLGLQAHVEPYLQASDVLACPSTWAEAAGLVNLEALAVGLPVVASCIGGIPEFVADGENGRLVPPNDPTALAVALRDLRDDPAIRQRLGQAARAGVVARSSTEVVVPAQLDVFRSLVPAAQVRDDRQAGRRPVAG